MPHDDGKDYKITEKYLWSLSEDDEVLYNKKSASFSLGGIKAGFLIQFPLTFKEGETDLFLFFLSSCLGWKAAALLLSRSQIPLF